ncbi:MAG: DUF3784 domain-containing protein [Clostridia bacterium]|nr:DUF3784 domain-containing protein [Clostridia bacterium]
MKNKHNLQRLIGVLIFAVGVVFIALGVLASTPNYGFIGIGLPFLIVGGIWYFIATSRSRGICDKCGQSMKGCSYEYQEMNREYSKSRDGGVHVKVHIRATCPHCGQDKTFEKTFYAGLNENIQFKVDQFCRSHFGH